MGLGIVVGTGQLLRDPPRSHYARDLPLLR